MKLRDDYPHHYPHQRLLGSDRHPTMMFHDRTRSGVKANPLNVLAALALGLGGGSALGDPVVLNPTGGVTLFDGLKISTENGAYQIVRNNQAQIYNPDNAPADLGVILVAENEIACASYSYSWTYEGLSTVEWNSSELQVTESSPGSWRSTETLTCTDALVGNRTYTVDVTTDYTAPNYYADVRYDVTVPSGSPGPVRLYLASDFYLDGSDDGPGLTRLVNGRRLVAQVMYQDNMEPDPAEIRAVGGVLEAPVETGVTTDYTSWVEAYYSCPFGDDDENCPGGPYGPVKDSLNPQGDGRYPNEIDLDPEQDAGIGAHWDLLATAGTPSTTDEDFVIKTQLYFASNLNALPGDDPDPPAPIPTLSVWGLMGTAGLMGLFGSWRQRRQSRRRA